MVRYGERRLHGLASAQTVTDRDDAKARFRNGLLSVSGRIFNSKEVRLCFVPAGVRPRVGLRRTSVPDDLV